MSEVNDERGKYAREMFKDVKPPIDGTYEKARKVITTNRDREIAKKHVINYCHEWHIEPPWTEHLIEHTAKALSDARAEERERCCGAVCGLCNTGEIKPIFREYNGLSAWVHRVGEVNRRCEAQAIRELGE